MPEEIVVPVKPELSKEQLNALLVICQNAPIKGGDAQFMAGLLNTLQSMLG